MKEYRMSEPKLFQKLIEVFGKISLITEKKILVIRDLEVALMLSIHNAVVYITDDEDCAEAFRKNTAAGMGNDDIVLHVNNWNNKLKFNKVFEKMEKKVGKKKFDAVIMNPPYDRNLHLKILETVIPHAEKVVNISPVRWLQDPFAPYSTRSDYCKFEDSISKKIETLDIITDKEASKLFDALFTMNLGIYVCSEQGGYNYRHDDPLITKIVEKTMECNWLPFSPKKFYCGLIEHKNFSIDIAPIHEIERIMCKTYDAQCQTPPMNKETAYDNQGGHFEFDTEAERRNFYDCYNHPFMKWHCRLWKSNSHVYSNKIPYFGDYTHPWDYGDFFTWFDLTKEEQERVMRKITEMQAE